MLYVPCLVAVGQRHLKSWLIDHRCIVLSPYSETRVYENMAAEGCISTQNHWNVTGWRGWNETTGQDRKPRRHRTRRHRVESTAAWTSSIRRPYSTFNVTSFTHHSQTAYSANIQGSKKNGAWRHISQQVTLRERRRFKATSFRRTPASAL